VDIALVSSQCITSCRPSLPAELHRVPASSSAAWNGNLGQMVQQTPCQARILHKNLRDRTKSKSLSILHYVLTTVTV
jgi:hypothetical protein